MIIVMVSILIAVVVLYYLLFIVKPDMFIFELINRIFGKEGRGLEGKSERR
jgi:hypothetical protein